MEVYSTLLIPGLISALVSASVVFLVTYITHRREVQIKQKELISSAYRAVIAYIEMVYRIRRRTKVKKYEEEDAMRIRNRFHEIQEEIAYYSTLLSLESKELGEKYKKLISKTKELTNKKLQDAWKTGGGISTPNRRLIEESDLNPEKEEFLKEAKKFIKSLGNKLL